MALQIPKIKIGGILGGLLGGLVKQYALSMLLSKIDSITPAQVEKMIDLDKWVRQLKKDPKNSKLLGYFNELEAKGVGAEKALAEFVLFALKIIPSIIEDKLLK